MVKKLEEMAETCHSLSNLLIGGTMLSVEFKPYCAPQFFPQISAGFRGRGGHFDTPFLPTLGHGLFLRPAHLTLAAFSLPIELIGRNRLTRHFRIARHTYFQNVLTMSDIVAGY